MTDEDWALTVSALRGEIYDSLTRSQKNSILVATWTLQDGYGEVGFTPPQGWDWSGIRDSSDEAHANIVSLVKSLLNSWGVKVDNEKIKAQAEEAKRVRAIIDAEFPELASLKKEIHDQG